MNELEEVYIKWSGQKDRGIKEAYFEWLKKKSEKKRKNEI